MKVLIVDDKPVSVKGIVDYCEDQHWDSKTVDFNDCYKEIIVSDPDVIVLDWCADPGDNSGMEILKSIWTNGYRPIVIFSGNIDIITLPEEYTNTGLIKMLKKGDEEPVYEFLNNLKDSHSAISSFRKELGKSVIEAFRVLDPIQKACKDYLGDDVIKYLLAKRAVNYFDLENIDVLLPAWAIYQYPPAINAFLTVCDILRKATAATDFAKIGAPEDYIILLTPSCDLVVSEGRTPKVENVLYAKCKNINGSKLGSIKKESRKEDALKTGKENEFALPALENVLPNMIVDMKQLGIISINRIAIDMRTYISEKDKYEYVRICSIDSPFREQMVWNFLNNIGRIGVPDRDYAAWAKSIDQKK